MLSTEQVKLFFVFTIVGVLVGAVGGLLHAVVYHVYPLDAGLETGTLVGACFGAVASIVAILWPKRPKTPGQERREFGQTVERALGPPSKQEDLRRIDELIAAARAKQQRKE